MEKKFVKPELEIIDFASDDVILTSGGLDIEEYPDTEIF